MEYHFKLQCHQRWNLREAPLLPEGVGRKVWGLQKILKIGKGVFGPHEGVYANNINGAMGGHDY